VTKNVSVPQKTIMSSRTCLFSPPNNVSQARPADFRGTAGQPLSISRMIVVDALLICTSDTSKPILLLQSVSLTQAFDHVISFRVCHAIVVKGIGLP
jgi:hypothetical protein